MKIYTLETIGQVELIPEANFESCEFQGIDFTLSNLKLVEFYKCRFINCNFANQSLLHTSFKEPVFDSCKLLGMNWTELKRLDQPKFIKSKIDLSNFNRVKLKKAEFIECSMIEVDFSESDLSFTVFSGSILSGSNFDGANITGADFRSSKNYLIDSRRTKIKGAKFSYPEAISLITVLGAEID